MAISTQTSPLSGRTGVILLIWMGEDSTDSTVLMSSLDPTGQKVAPTWARAAVRMMGTRARTRRTMSARSALAASQCFRTVWEIKNFLFFCRIGHQMEGWKWGEGGGWKWEGEGEGARGR